MALLHYKQTAGAGTDKNGKIERVLQICTTLMRGGRVNKAQAAAEYGGGPSGASSGTSTISGRFLTGSLRRAAASGRSSVTVSVEGFGKDIYMWLRSQGSAAELLEEETL